MYEGTESDWQIPEFNTDQLKPKSKPFCLMVFVINEGQRIQKQLASSKVISEELDIIIADGGSTDESVNLAFLEEQQVTARLTKTGAGKLSAQMRMGFAYAIAQGYEGVICIDGNNKDLPLEAIRHLEMLKKGYHHVQGSRFIAGGVAINTPLIRWLAIRLLHAPLISLASGRNQTDTTNGFRGYRTELLTDPNLQIFRDCFSSYELHFYLAIRSARLGYRLTEVPVTRQYPKGEKAPTKISPWRGNLKVLITLLAVALGRFNPSNLGAGYESQ